MGRKIAFIIVICLLALGFSGKKAYKAANLADLMRNEGLELLEANVSGWVKREDDCLNYQKGEDLIRRICNFMDIDFSSCSIVREKENIKISAISPYENGTIGIIVENVYNNIMGSFNTTIIMNITQHAEFENIINIRERMEQCLNQLGEGPPVNLCITGYIDGELKEQNRHAVIDNIMEKLEAVEQKTIEYDNLISVTGYTEYISKFVKSNGKKINVNTACRYSPSDSRTYFWIGTPVINVEY